jgi:transposase
MSEELIQMSRTEMERLRILHRFLDHQLRQKKAAELMGVTDRHVRRLVKRVREEGDSGIIHRSRGRPSSRRIPEARQRQTLELVRNRYRDFGPTLAVEKLWEHETIRVSRETLRQWMVQEGLWRVRSRRGRKIYQWRERKHHRGEMIQMDGSHHDWLEGRGPELVLMGYVDDANNEFFGRFYEYEGIYPAMDSFQCYIEQYSIPTSVYLDRHSTYKTTREPSVEEALRGEQALTQFARALSELGIKLIYAHSPQAKGRIERIFETLQDRLIKEMRLAGISTAKEANRFLQTYLPRFNHQFGKIPLGKSNLHRPIPKDLRLQDIFCIKESRHIAQDYTVRWKNRTFRIQKPRLTMKRQRLVVLEQFDGTIRMKFHRKEVAFVEVTDKIPRPAAQTTTPARTERSRSSPYIPPPHHPWRRRFLRPKRRPILPQPRGYEQPLPF